VSNISDDELKTKNLDQAFRLLLIQGLSKLDAGNRLAGILGLAVVEKHPWTVHELNAILFLKELNRHLDR
jgi:hypothetical protein